MKDPCSFDAAVNQIPKERFRELLRRLRGENRDRTSSFSVMVTSGLDRLTDEQINELKQIFSGFLPVDLLKTSDDIMMAATAIAGRSVKIY